MAKQSPPVPDKVANELLDKGEEVINLFTELVETTNEIERANDAKLAVTKRQRDEAREQASQARTALRQTIARHVAAAQEANTKVRPHAPIPRAPRIYFRTTASTIRPQKRPPPPPPTPTRKSRLRSTLTSRSEKTARGTD